MADLASIKATVSGRVTGIGFRANVKVTAQRLGLTGYVRNLPGGNAVEVEAEGERSGLEKLSRYLSKGPPLAKVDTAEITWSGYSGKYPDFSIVR